MTSGLRWGIPGVVRPDWMWSCSPGGRPTVVHARAGRGAARMGTTNGAPVRRGHPQAGRGWRYDGVDDYHQSAGVIDHNIGTGDFTVMVLATYLGVGAGSPVAFAANGGAASSGVLLFVYLRTNGGASGWGAFATSDWRPSSKSLTIGETYLLSVNRRGSTLHFFCDGVRDSTTHTITSSAGENVARVGFGNAVNSYANTSVYWSALWAGRCLTGPEQEAVFMSRWDPYATIRTARWKVPAVGGGTIIPRIMHHRRMMSA